MSLILCNTDFKQERKSLVLFCVSGLANRGILPHNGHISSLKVVAFYVYEMRLTMVQSGY